MGVYVTKETRPIHQWVLICFPSSRGSLGGIPWCAGWHEFAVRFDGCLFVSHGQCFMQSPKVFTLDSLVLQGVSLEQIPGFTRCSVVLKMK